MSITALIVTFNRLEKLKRCWTASKVNAFEHIIIVDNASTDGTGHWLSGLSEPRLKVLTLGENRGGAGGFKLGVDFILDRIDTDWVVFYDDDAYPPDGFSNRFAAVKDAQWGAYCCNVVDEALVPCKMNVPYAKLPRGLRQDLGEFIGGRGKSMPLTEGQKVDSFSFVGAIVSKYWLQQGREFLKPELFIYFDDLYFSYHLTLVGCAIRYTPELVFIHDIEVNKKRNIPSWKVYYLVRNLLLSRTRSEEHTSELQ